MNISKCWLNQKLSWITDKTSLCARLLISIIFLTGTSVSAGPTRVGNGDDGADLESIEDAVPVKSGILQETRNDALARLRKLQVGSIEGLGLLIPEVEKTEILLVGRNIDFRKMKTTPIEQEDALEVARAIGAVGDKNQLVYARTFAEPHAATRFFPAALMLDRSQLIALHIHEALHRALPTKIRENEKAVSRITLAITAPDTSFDRIKQAVTREMKVDAASDEASRSEVRIEDGQSDGKKNRIAPELHSRQKINYVEYGYRSYFLPDVKKSVSPISALHSLKSFMYPFGAIEKRELGYLGLGLEFTFVGLTDRWYLGPVGLATRIRVAKLEEFDVQIRGDLHLNTVSAGEIREIPVGRDTGTIGLVVLREDDRIRIENQMYFVPGSIATQFVSGNEVTHRYGSTFGARFAATGKWPRSEHRSVEIGGLAEVLLSGPYEVMTSTTLSRTDRIRVVSVGPEFGYRVGDLRFSLSGRFVLDSTRDLSLDQLGDLLGQGVGQGSVGAAASWSF
jgi:hypothetical protein